MLRTRFGVRHLLFSGMPPMHAFPALPQPLRWYLGTRARRFDQALARWASRQPDCEHIPLILGDLRQFASDGMHPGPLGYREWSVVLARRIRVRWTSSPAAPM